jgi:hypothetical protein
MRAATELLAWRSRFVSPAERYSKLGLVYDALDFGLFFVPTAPVPTSGTRWGRSQSVTAFWRIRPLQPKTAFSRFPPVHKADLEGQQRVGAVDCRAIAILSRGRIARLQGRLGKDRSPRQSRHSIASAKYASPPKWAKAPAEHRDAHSRRGRRQGDVVGSRGVYCPRITCLAQVLVYPARQLSKTADCCADWWPEHSSPSMPRSS